MTKKGNDKGLIGNIPDWVSIILLILIAVLPSVFAYGTLNNRVDNLESFDDYALERGQYLRDDLNTNNILTAENNINIKILIKNQELMQDDINKMKDHLFEK